MGTRREWVIDFLMLGSYPTTDDNVRACLAWSRSEFGGSAPFPAAFNAYATTQPAPGATDYNGVGVKNYPDWWAGVRANVDTLAQDFPGYQSVRDHLMSGQDASATCAAVSASPWGSHPNDEILAEVLNDPANNADAFAGERPGTPPEPTPVPEPTTQTEGDDMIGILHDGTRAWLIQGGVVITEFGGVPTDTGFGVSIPKDAADAITRQHYPTVILSDGDVGALAARSAAATVPPTADVDTPPATPPV